MAERENPEVAGRLVMGKPELLALGFWLSFGGALVACGGRSFADSESAAIMPPDEAPTEEVVARDGGVAALDAETPPAPTPAAPVPDEGVEVGNPWRLETIDGRGQMLSDVSSALGRDGRLHVAYMDSAQAKLMYAVGRPGHGFVTEPVATAAGMAARRTAIAVDDQGLVHIAFWIGNGARYASGTAGAWSTQDVGQPVGNAVGYMAIAARSENDVVIAFRAYRMLLTARNSSDGDFVAEYTGLSGQGASLLQSQGKGLELAYADYLVSDMTTAPPRGSFVIFHAVETEGQWRTQAIDGLPEEVSALSASPFVALASGRGGRRYVAFYLPTDYGRPLSGADAGVGQYEPTVSELRHAASQSGAWVVETVDASGNFGGEVSFEVDARGASHISYHELDRGELRYATNQSGSWSSEIVDTEEGAGYHAALELDSTQKPIIVYCAAGSRELRVATR